MTLLTVIGEEAREVFATFAWTTADDSGKIVPVLKKLEEYVSHAMPCHVRTYPLKGIVSTAGYKSQVRYNQYHTALLKLAAGCEFDKITPDEILRQTGIWNQG